MFDAEKFVADHQGTDVYEIIELAYEQGKADGHSEQLGTNFAEVGTDLISRAAAQTELQLSARRYTVAHEAHGEGRVVWSEDLISVSDAMDVLRKIPSAEPTFDARDTQYNLPIGTDCISRQQAIDALRNYLVGKNVPCDGTLTCRLIENEVINKLPSAESESFEWCTDCKEYDQEAHCCHRFSKMIRKTIEEMQIVHCIDCQHSEYDSVYDERWCHYNGKAEVVDDYHFCSCAERRKDG